METLIEIGLIYGILTNFQIVVFPEINSCEVNTQISPISNLHFNFQDIEMKGFPFKILTLLRHAHTNQSSSYQ